NPLALLCSRQLQAFIEAVPNGLVAARSGEHEVDRRQEVFASQSLDDLEPLAPLRAVPGRASMPSSLTASGFGRPSTKVGRRWRRSAERSPTTKRFFNSTGRCCSMTTPVAPRTSEIQAPSWSALATVADRQTSVTFKEAPRMTSSQTPPL